MSLEHRDVEIMEQLCFVFSSAETGAITTGNGLVATLPSQLRDSHKRLRHFLMQFYTRNVKENIKTLSDIHIFTQTDRLQRVSTVGSRDVLESVPRHCAPKLSKDTVLHQEHFLFYPFKDFSGLL